MSARSLQPTAVDFDESPEEPIDSPPANAQSPMATTPEPQTDEESSENPLSTLAGVIGELMDHLECAIHTILYERNIYPPEIFITARKYNCGVKMSRAPVVNEFVRNAVETVGEQILQGNVQVVSVVIISPKNQPLERFNFDVSCFPEVDKTRLHSVLVHENAVGDQDIDLPGTSLADLYEQFRAVMVQLSLCSGKLGKIPPECTWTIMLEMKEDSGPPKDHTRKWVVEEQQATSKNSSSVVGLGLGGVNTIPLRTIENGALSMEVWIEESNVKGKLAA